LATKQKTTNTTDSSTSELIKQKTSSWNYTAVIRATWPDKERLLIGRLSDSYSLKSTRSHVTDAHLSTLVFERQPRVASQLPTGKIYALSSEDDGAALLMNLIMNKYVYKHANSQFDLLTKLRMSGVYASAYGAQPILYDYRIDDEYIGPDCWLIPIRNFYPQPGKNDIRDMDWAMVSKIESVSFLEAITKRKNTKWNTKNIQTLIDELKTGGSPSRDLNSDRKSAVENLRNNGTPYQDKDNGVRVELVTKYEKGTTGRWITFAPDYPEVGKLRDIPNPHKSGQIPIVMRQCFPLLDSPYGLGDFERGITLQKAKDSLINLYLDAVKLSIFPPLKVDLANVTASTIRQEAGARWLMKDLNAVAPYQTSPVGMETFQGTYQFLTTALLNQNGTTDTSVSSADGGNPAYGKTPQAIAALQQRENARDNWDRFMLEKTMEDLFEGMINLIGENQEKPINFHLFDDDIKTVEDQFDEDDLKGFMKKVNSRVAKVTIPKSLIGGQYKFCIDASSSMSKDEEAQDAALTEIITFYLQGQQMIDQALQQDGMKFNLAQAFKAKVINSGIQDWDDIIEDHSDDEQGEQEQGMPGQQQPPMQMPQFQDPKIQQLAQQMFGQQAQGQPSPQPQTMPQQQAPQQPMQPNQGSY